MLLTELLTPERIKIPLESRTKDEVIGELVDVLTRSWRSSAREQLLEAVRQREEVLSTGIGNRVAIPHGKSDAAPELGIAVGLAREPVDFNALDGQPVQLVFLLVGPEDAPSAHVQALSRIARLVRSEQVREQLIGARDAGHFYTALAEAERR